MCMQFQLYSTSTFLFCSNNLRTPSSFLTSSFSMHLRLITVAFVNNRDVFCGDFSASNTKEDLTAKSNSFFLTL